MYSHRPVSFPILFGVFLILNIYFQIKVSCFTEDSIDSYATTGPVVLVPPPRTKDAPKISLYTQLPPDVKNYVSEFLRHSLREFNPHEYVQRSFHSSASENRFNQLSYEVILPPSNMFSYDGVYLMHCILEQHSIITLEDSFISAYFKVIRHLNPVNCPIVGLDEWKTFATRRLEKVSKSPWRSRFLHPGSGSLFFKLIRRWFDIETNFLRCIGVLDLAKSCVDATDPVRIYTYSSDPSPDIIRVPKNLKKLAAYIQSVQRICKNPSSHRFAGDLARLKSLLLGMFPGNEEQIMNILNQLANPEGMIDIDNLLVSFYISIMRP
jgi:hypothetical protein